MDASLMTNQLVFSKKKSRLEFQSRKGLRLIHRNIEMRKGIVFDEKFMGVEYQHKNGYLRIWKPLI